MPNISTFSILLIWNIFLSVMLSNMLSLSNVLHFWFLFQLMHFYGPTKQTSFTIWTNWKDEDESETSLMSVECAFGMRWQSVP